MVMKIIIVVNQLLVASQAGNIKYIQLPQSIQAWELTLRSDTWISHSADTEDWHVDLS